jgi:4-hydroxy 2-oxovalerate aldolase
MKGNNRIYLVDTTLRDGSHAVTHQYSKEKTRAIAKGLADSGMDFIEISHGDGLSGSSQNYGWGLCSDRERLMAARDVVGNSNLTVLLLPGIGTVEDLKMAKSCGANTVRVATHITEADVGEQHVRMAKELGMTAVGFLMMAHMASVEKLVEQAKLFESYGADIVYVADSAGTMLPNEVKERVAAVTKGVSVPVGFHAHNNFGLAIGNDLAAIEAGATYLDGTLRGLGAGAGNAPIEELAAVLDKAGYDIGVDIYRLMDVAEEQMKEIAKDSSITTSSLMIGYAGVYSSFLLHTKRAAERFHLNPRDILVELGRRKMVGGQEDMIIDVAYELSRKA